MTSRTNEERRRETIGKLLDSTIDSLATRGYARTSTSKICSGAGVSQGALFNHFDTRTALVVEATDEICRRHVARLEQLYFDPAQDISMTSVIEFVRASARSTEHAAWQEVMMAARTDEELREAVAPSVAAFEGALADVAERLLPDVSAERAALVVLSLLHMFDSEAITSRVFPNDDLERARTTWAAMLLEREANG